MKPLTLTCCFILLVGGWLIWRAWPPLPAPAYKEQEQPFVWSRINWKFYGNHWTVIEFPETQCRILIDCPCEQQERQPVCPAPAWQEPSPTWQEPRVVYVWTNGMAIANFAMSESEVKVTVDAVTAKAFKEYAEEMRARGWEVNICPQECLAKPKDAKKP